MKRAFRLIPRKFAAVTCLAALALGTLAPYATAGMWVQKEIKWHLTSVGTPTNPTGIYNRDTTYRVISPAQLDTTGEFSLSRADVFRNGHSGAAAIADTITVGYLVFQGDSSVAIGSSVSSLTLEVDGRAAAVGASSGNSGWVQVDSLVVKPVNSTSGTDGPTSVAIAPLRGIQTRGIPDVAGTDLNQFYKILSMEDLRVRITAITGSMTSARVWVRYWDEEAQPPGSR